MIGSQLLYYTSQYKMLHLSKHRSSLMLLLPLTTQPLHSFLFLALISRRRINQSNNVHVPVCLGQHARGLAEDIRIQ